MELFEGMIHDLKPPWSQRLKSILVDPQIPYGSWDSTMMVSAFGRSSHFDLGMWCQMAELKPFLGLQLVEPSFWLHFPSENALTLCEGSWFGFSGVSVQSIDYDTRIARMVPDEKSNFWFISEMVENFPINMIHCFSGAYGGWERASYWLHQQKFVHVQQTLAIDNDEEVMKVWQLRTEAVMCIPPIARSDFHGEKNVGILCGIESDGWLNVCRSQSNVFMTMSPPCQPWSMGGKAQGFESYNGLMFAHVIRKVKLTRPLAVCAECADQITAHIHFRIIKGAFSVIGYKLIWSNIMNTDGLGMQRSRWLAVWIRNDVEATSVGRFKLLDVQQIRWSNPLYSFQFPSQVEHQLKLSSNLMEIYGNIKLLPKSFHSGLGPHPNVTDVLRARCIGQQAVMPTLVASYSQQHHLDKSHLEAKGVFASLVEENGSFHFIDPFRFISLLGTPCLEIVPVPIKIDIAFRHLGNSISTMHALTCILVAVTATKMSGAEVTSTVMQCWQDRFSTENSIVIRSKDYAFVVPHALVTKVMIDECRIQPKTECNICIQLDSGEVIDIDFFEGMRFIDVMKNFGVEKLTTSHVSLCTDFEVVDHTCEVATKFDTDVHCRNKSSIIFTMRFLKPQPCANQEVSETRSVDMLDDAIRKGISQVERNAVAQQECSPTVPYGNQHGDLVRIVDVPCPVPTRQCDHTEDNINDEDTLLEDVFWIFMPGSDTPIEMMWPRHISKDAVETRVKFLQKPDDLTILKAVECMQHPFENIKRVFLMVPDNIHDHFMTVLVWNESRGLYRTKCLTPSVIPWNIDVKEMPDVASIAINAEVVPMFELCNIHSGDVIQLSTAKKIRLEHIQALPSTADRASLFQIHGPSLASDELEWCAQQFNTHQHNFTVKGPVSPVAFLHKIHDFVAEHCKQGFLMTVIPILFQDHWAACEIKGSSNISLAFINVPSSFEHFHSEAKMRVELLAMKSTTSKKINVPAPDGFLWVGIIATLV